MLASSQVGAQSFPYSWLTHKPQTATQPYAPQAVENLPQITPTVAHTPAFQGQGFPGHCTAPHHLLMPAQGASHLQSKTGRGGKMRPSALQPDHTSQQAACDSSKPSTQDPTGVKFQGSLCAHSPPPPQPLKIQLQSIFPKPDPDHL